MPLLHNGPVPLRRMVYMMRWVVRRPHALPATPCRACSRTVPPRCMVGIAYVARCDAYCTRAMQAYLLSVLSSVRSRDTGMLRFCSVVEPSLS